MIPLFRPLLARSEPGALSPTRLIQSLSQHVLDPLPQRHKHFRRNNRIRKRDLCRSRKAMFLYQLTDTQLEVRVSPCKLDECLLAATAVRIFGAG